MEFFLFPWRGGRQAFISEHQHGKGREGAGWHSDAYFPIGFCFRILMKYIYISISIYTRYTSSRSSRPSSPSSPSPPSHHEKPSLPLLPSFLPSLLPFTPFSHCHVFIRVRVQGIWISPVFSILYLYIYIYIFRGREGISAPFSRIRRDRCDRCARGSCGGVRIQ